MLTDRKAIRLPSGWLFTIHGACRDGSDEDIKYVNSAAVFGLQVALENALYTKASKGLLEPDYLEKYPYQDELGSALYRIKMPKTRTMTGKKQEGLISAAALEEFWEWKSFCS